MPVSTAEEHFLALDEKVPLEEYNYEHFLTKHLVKDGKRTVTRCGIPPGELAPDFELPGVGGDRLRLSQLRGRPVLLHFGSIS